MRTGGWSGHTLSHSHPQLTSRGTARSYERAAVRRAFPSDALPSSPRLSVARINRGRSMRHDDVMFCLPDRQEVHVTSSEAAYDMFSHFRLSSDQLGLMYVTKCLNKSTGRSQPMCLSLCGWKGAVWSVHVDRCQQRIVTHDTIY
jgi:hypothetical protein